MKASKELVKGFRGAANLIEQDPEKFNWYKTTKCNCGILTQVLCNITESKLDELLKNPEFFDKEDSLLPLSTTWCRIAVNNSNYCRQTGFDLWDIFTQLKSFGLTKDDIINIEVLNHVNYLTEDDFRHYDCSDPVDVIAWFRLVADRLEEQLKEETE